jgi:hypothetical protein
LWDLGILKEDDVDERARVLLTTMIGASQAAYGDGST